MDRRIRGNWRALRKSTAADSARHADARTDVFSLGVIAYEMLSGELPFGRGSLTDVILAQARGVQPMRAGIVPPPLDRAIRVALETAPERRPASAQAFARLLDGVDESLKGAPLT